MNSFQQYIIPWTISQVVSLIILFLAIKKPVWTRYIFAVIFIAAGIFNWFTAIRTPEAYLIYASTAIAPYREFITGWFAGHVTIVIPLIATGQIMMGLLMFIGGRWLALGCIGIILFLLLIAPLGVGSAFPFSITVSIAAYLVYRKIRMRRRDQRNEGDDE
jgi:hypothetical protein